MLIKQYLAELIGSFFFTFISCGVYIFYGLIFDEVDHYIEVAFVFGVTYISLYSMFGKISGCVLNPAISLALLVFGRLSFLRSVLYSIAQTIGSLLAAAVLYSLVRNNINFGYSNSFFASGFDSHSPSDSSMLTVFVVNSLVTAFLVTVFIKTTSKVMYKNRMLNGVIISMVIIATSFMTLPVSRMGVNPAISFAFSLFAPGWALEQLWLMLLSTLVGACLGALFTKYFFKQKELTNIFK